ncbi:LppA family lipoprotein [Williamsia soli]|uniref:LppA family lipoprotein n=1 Tax=Williamsia soli TaxID=364929 RepID=UPI001A9ED357|nr:LppA family lipoprotein [Williamsia soli]
MYESTDDPYGGKVSAEELSRNDQHLRGLPSYQDSIAQLDAFLVVTSDALTKAFPYLQFSWSNERTFTTCHGYSENAYRGQSATRLADLPVAPDDWDRAFRIVVDHAATLGPVETGAFHDQSTVHDTLITAGGFSIRFGSIKATGLSGDTPCRLPQSVLDQAP